MAASALAGVMACALFAAVSGSSPATVVAIGSIILPAMIKQGFPARFGAGVITTSGALGILIPPSIVMVMYAVATNTSVGALFIAGIVPGLILATMLGVTTWWRARKFNYPRQPVATWGERLATFRKAIWGLFLIIVVIGGIYSGIFTPTEAAAMSAVYAFFVAVFVYKDMTLKQVPKVLLDSANMSAMLLYIITNAVMFSYLMTSEQIPQELAAWMLDKGLGAVAFLLFVNVVLLLAGNVMEPSSIVLIMAPILFPVAMKLGIDPVHFGIMMTVNMEVGMCHPPVGLNLYVASGIAKMGITELTIAVWPWLLTMLVFLDRRHLLARDVDLAAENAGHDVTVISPPANFGIVFPHITIRRRSSMLNRNAALAVRAGDTAGGVFAQDYPNKQVVLVVPFAAGGPTDTLARNLGVTLTKLLKQQIIVDNAGGAGGTIGINKVAKARNDGYTLLLMHIGMSTSPALYRKLPYDTLNDFEYIGQVADVPMTMLGKKALPPNNLKELLPYLKANKDKLTYANAGLGAASHLCGLLFMSQNEIDLTTVPYKGTAPAMTDLVGGQVDLMCDQTTNTTQQIKAGTVKVYGVTSAQRVPSLKDVPTLAEQGMKGLRSRRVARPLRAERHAQTGARQTGRRAAGRGAGCDVQGAPRRTRRRAGAGRESESGSAAHHLQAEINKWGPIIKKAGQYAD